MPNSSQKVTKDKNGDTIIVRKEEMVYTRKNMGALEFIKNVLAPKAISAVTRQGQYLAWTEVSGNKTYINFMTKSAKSQADIAQNYIFEVGNASGNSPVISFTPKYTIVPDAEGSEPKVEAALLDKFTNQMFTLNYGSSGPYTALTAEERKQTDNNKITYFAASGYTNKEVERLAADLWLRQSKLSFEAELVILGDPGIRPFTNISVICIMPSGLPHLSSGVYLVTGVAHQIEGGRFTTTLTLLRNSIEVSVDENGQIKFIVGEAEDPNADESSDDDKDSTTDSSSTSGSGSSTGSTNAGGDRGKYISELRKHIGAPYVWGAAGPSTFDCSGLVWYCLRAIGKLPADTPRGTTYTMRDSSAYGKLINATVANAPVGAIIVCSGGEHVVVASGGGKVIHAPQPGDSVKEVDGGWVTGIVAVRDPFA